MQDGLLLHHFVIFNPAQTGHRLPDQRALLRRRQRAHAPAPAVALRLPQHERELEHDHAPREQEQRCADGQHRDRLPLATVSPRPSPRARRGSTSTRSAPGATPSTRSRSATPTRTADWTVPQNARIIGMSGHLHDIDIIDPSPMPGALLLARGGDRAQRRAAGRRRQRLLRPDPAQQPAAGGHHGRDAVPVGGVSRHRASARSASRANGHMDTMSPCGINSRPAGRRAGGGIPGRRRLLVRGLSDQGRPGDPAALGVPEQLRRVRRRT